MEITAILIGLTFFIVSLGFVSMPFRRKPQRTARISEIPVQEDEQRAAVLSALRDLDFDFRIGKVNEEDYTPMRQRLLAEAAQYIERETKEDEKLETLIEARRAASKQGVSCNRCGAPVKAGQQFCVQCGSPVDGKFCPQCGKKNQMSDQFCSSCGTRLEVQKEAVV